VVLVTATRRSGALALVMLAFGCSYTLAPPNVARDAVATDRGPVPPDAADVPVVDGGPNDDRVVPVDGGPDGTVPTDQGEVPDVGVDAGFDTGSPVDTGIPTDLGEVRDVPDAGSLDRGPDPVDTGIPTDQGGPVDVGVPTDLGAPTDLGPAGDSGACTPTTRRLCWTGPPAARGQGVCRDGIETCLGSGTWGPCEGQIVPDCAGRVCGSNGCGGTCGNCVQGEVCDDTGRCATPLCGSTNFTTTCTGGFTCPANGRCNSDRSCGCLDGYVAQRCDGTSCGGTCTFPFWYCARAAFCGGGAIVCPGGYLCPRWARCDTDTRSCACQPGFRAVECGGVACQDCPGTAYRCQRV